MGRLVFLLGSIIAINIALLIFTCGQYNENGQCVASSASTVIPNSSFWDFVQNPSSYDSSQFWQDLFGSVSGIAGLIGTVILVGSLIFRSELGIYAGLGISFVGLVGSWIKLYQNIQSSSIIGDPASRKLVAIIIAVPIIITYIATIVDWIRGRD